MSYNDILLLVDLGNRKMTCRFALLFRQFNLNKVDVCIYFLQVATTKIYCTLYQIWGSLKLIAWTCSLFMHNRFCHHLPGLTGVRLLHLQVIRDTGVIVTSEWCCTVIHLATIPGWASSTECLDADVFDLGQTCNQPTQLISLLHTWIQCVSWFCNTTKVNIVHYKMLASTNHASTLELRYGDYTFLNLVVICEMVTSLSFLTFRW